VADPEPCPAGRDVAENGPDAKLLDVATGRQAVIPNVYGHGFISIAFTNDNRLFVTGTPDDKSLRLWEVSLPSGGGK
jgi:hypothetical protein